MELWDIYDRDRIKTDRSVERGKVMNIQDFHIVIHICIFNSAGQMLIQQRQPFKEGWPDKWDITVGGSAISGDTSQMAAQRELMEELGYDFDFSHMRPSFTLNFADGFDDFYILKADIDTDSLTLQYEEVQKVKWADKDEIMGLIDQNTFLPYHKSLIDMIFDMKDYMGGHTR